MRCVCRDLRQIADALCATASLHLPSGDGLQAVAAFHLRLPSLRLLKVHLACDDANEALPPPASQPAASTASMLQLLDQCRQYHAAAGRDGLRATQCHITVQGAALPVAAISALLRALPRLRVLTVQDMAPERPHRLHIKRLLWELAACPQLEALHLDMRNSMHWIEMSAHMDALTRLTQLRTLTGTWRIDADAWARLAAGMPQLQGLGASYFDVPASACSAADATEPAAPPAQLPLPPLPNLRSVLGPYQPSRQAPALPWHCPTAPFSLLKLPLLSALPGLRDLHDATLYVGPDMLALAEHARTLRSVSERFAHCADHWSLSPWLHGGHGPPLALLRLQPGSLAAVRIMRLDINPAFVRDDGHFRPPPWLGDAFMAITAAAPGITQFALRCGDSDDGNEVPASGFLGHVVGAAVPALRRLQRLHTLWLSLSDGAQSVTSAAMLVGVATGLCMPGHGHGAGGDGSRGCTALRKLLVYCSSDEAWGVVRECRQVLQHLRVPLSLEGFWRAL